MLEILGDIFVLAIIVWALFLTYCQIRVMIGVFKGQDVGPDGRRYRSIRN